MNEFYKISNKTIWDLDLDSLYLYIEMIRGASGRSEYIFTYNTLLQTRNKCPGHHEKALTNLEKMGIITKSGNHYCIKTSAVNAVFTVLREDDYAKIMSSGYHNRGKLLAHFMQMASTINKRSMRGWSSWSKIALRENTTIQTVIHMNHQLEKLGMIEIHQRFNDTCVYNLTELMFDSIVM